jgi:hypothetical protein
MTINGYPLPWNVAWLLWEAMMTPEPAADGSALVEAPAGPPRAAVAQARLFSQRRSLLALAGILILLGLATIYHYAIYVPQPDQPHLLTLLDDVFALGVFGLVGLVGLALGLRALRPFKLVGFSRLERGALAVGLGWGIISFGVLGLGLAHLLYTWALLAGLLLALLLCWREVRRLWALLTTRATYHLPHGIRPQGFFEGTLAAALIVELVLLGTNWLAPYPALAYDNYQYHWAVPNLFLFHHAIYTFPGWAHADFPFTDEMLNTVALAFQAPVAALLIQGTFGLLAVLLIASYLYRHAGRTAAWLGAALCLGSPLFLGLLTDGYVEVALSYDAVASLLVVLAWLKEPAQGGMRGHLRWLLLSGLFVGLGLAAKYTEGQIVVGIGLLLAGALTLSSFRAWRRGERQWSAFRRALLALLLYSLGALAPLLPWLAKDWAMLGNPIYPFIWGGPGWDAARTEVGVVTFAHFGPRGPLWQRLLEAFTGLFFDTGRSGEPALIPPNYLLLSVLAAPLVLAGEWLVRRKQQALPQAAPQPSSLVGVSPWLLVAGFAYLAWALSNALVGRYAMPWVLLLAVPAAVILLRLLQWSHRWIITRMLTQGTILAAVLALGTIFSSLYWLSDNPFPLVTGQESLHQWEAQHIMEPAYWAMVDYVNTSVPRSAKVLLLGRGTGYFLEGRDYIADSGDDWIPYLETEGKSEAGILALLRQDGFRYVIYEEKTLNYVVHVYDNSYLGSFLRAFRQFLHDSLTQIWAYKNFSVYQVPP